MQQKSEFVDYYDVLKVKADVDARALEVAYHYFAKMYHPDNSSTSDVDRFAEVLEAYHALKDPQKRADYDREYFARLGIAKHRATMRESVRVAQEDAISDGRMHLEILLKLYRKRRENASDPGVIGWLLREEIGCPEDQFEFHIWYLKSKGYLEITEQGMLALTITGVDHVIGTSQEAEKAKLLIAHDSDSPKVE